MEFSKEKYFGLGNVPIGIGAVLKGWDILEENYRDKNRLQVVDFRAMTNACLHDCGFCFTEKNKRTLTKQQIFTIIDQLSERKTHAINYLGEGEPTLDKNFLEIIEYTSSKGIIPVVFTDAATKLLNKELIKKLYDIGASISPKCDSLFNAEYQNSVVKDYTKSYFKKRNQSIQLLIEHGFNQIQKDGTTRLGFDMVITKENMQEIEQTVHYCRDNNIWIVFSTYLPSGRTSNQNINQNNILSISEKKSIRNTIKKVDQSYGFSHMLPNNFLTNPCVEFIQIYGNGNVSPCPGNETIIGNILQTPIQNLEKRILEQFPGHNKEYFDGNCLYREKY